MYSTCIFCHADLGRNAALERFPVGRRLAYDPDRGRLWVVCRRCERWNLSPLDERWEAIEDAERLYRDTRIKVATDNIGLARVRADGGAHLELVRVGPAERPELAAWRYGDQFGRRRRMRLLRVGLGIGAVGAAATAIVVAGVSAGVSVGGGGWWIWRLGASMAQRVISGSPDAVVARVPTRESRDAAAPSAAAARVLSVRRKDVRDVRLYGAGGGPLRLEIRHRDGITDFEGEEAFRVAGHVLPAVNHAGATRLEVDHATRLVGGARSALGFFEETAAHLSAVSRVEALAAPLRLALEMAAHEEQERRAMEGELALLAAAWREAETIARIADDLLVPPSVEEQLGRLRERRG